MKQLVCSKTIAAIAATVVLGLTSNLTAQTIGAGPGIVGMEGRIQVDTPSDGVTDQSRLNIDDTFTVTLPAGEYSATSWSYHAGQVGSVIPFLAYETAADVYQLLSSGDQVDVGADGLDADVTAPWGGANFTLTEATEVFAGIVNPVGEGSQNPIYTNRDALDSSGIAATVDHDNNVNGGVSAALDTGVAEGFGHANLPRAYAFSIDVAAVPEPSAGLMALGLAGWALIKLRRRS